MVPIGTMWLCGNHVWRVVGCGLNGTLRRYDLKLILDLDGHHSRAASIQHVGDVFFNDYRQIDEIELLGLRLGGK